MANGSHKLGSKQFFTMSVLAVSVLGLIFVTGAALKPTNTQSDASGGCPVLPAFTSAGVRSETNYVVYSYNLKNQNPTNCSKILYGFYVTLPSSKWSVDYRKNDGSWLIVPELTGSLKSGYSDVVKARIRPPSGAASKTYYLKAYTCQAFLVEGQIMTGPNYNCISKTINYVVN